MNTLIKGMLLILASIESSPYGDCAMGDWSNQLCDYKAYGSFQIHREALEDVNEAYGTCYQHEEMLEYDKAIFVAERYLMLCSDRYVRRYGVLPTEKELAMMYNGGANTHFKNIEYWNKYVEAKKD